MDLRPLYELVTAELFPDDSEIVTKQTLLNEEINNYIRAYGDDVRKAVLHYGDQVVLCLVAKGPARYLSTVDPTYARTSKLSSEPGHDDALRWIIV